VRGNRAVVAVALGGAAGAAARYALGLAFGDRPGSFPWTTFAVNITGCLALGVLVTGLVELSAPHRLLRPALGTGVLGGYTTFSTYAEQARALVANGRPGLAALYVLGTLVAALIAVRLGMLAVRAAVRLRRRQ